MVMMEIKRQPSWMEGMGTLLYTVSAKRAKVTTERIRCGFMTTSVENII